MCMQNIFNGVIWFVLPVLLVAANDTFAYICGFFIGKKYIQVPLISLSVSFFIFLYSLTKIVYIYVKLNMFSLKKVGKDLSVAVY